MSFMLTNRPEKQIGTSSGNITPTCPGCWPGIAALTLMVVPLVPKAGGGMLGAKGGLVNKTRAWGPAWGGGGGAVGVVVGVFGPVVVAEELVVEL